MTMTLKQKKKKKTDFVKDFISFFKTWEMEGLQGCNIIIFCQLLLKTLGLSFSFLVSALPFFLRKILRAALN